jgi:hypothetical protein
MMNFLQVGHLIHFSLEHWSSVIQYRHSVGIKGIFTDLEGTRVAFIDDHNNGFVYMPVSFVIYPIVLTSYLTALPSTVHRGNDPNPKHLKASHRNPLGLFPSISLCRF